MTLATQATERRGVALASFYDSKQSVIVYGSKSLHIHILDSHTKTIACTTNSYKSIKTKDSKFHAHIDTFFVLTV